MPVVSTTIGAEGLPVKDGETILIADEAAEFAEAVARVLKSEKLRKNLSKQSRNLLLQNHSWDRVISNFLELIRTTGLQIRTN